MPRIIEADSDGTIVVRLYMKLNRSEYPELVALIDGLPRRKQNRIMKSLVFRAALASAQNIPTELPPVHSRTPLNATPHVEADESGPCDWLTPEDMAKAFEFGMGSPAIEKS